MIRLDLHPARSAKGYLGTRVVHEGKTLATGHGAVICEAARKLIAQGHHPATPVEVYRNETLCFLPATLGTFAGLTVKESPSPHFARYAPPPQDRAAPLTANVKDGQTPSEATELPLDPDRPLALETPEAAS